MTIGIVVDGKPIEVDASTCLLDACLDNGITIPHLCHMPGMDHPQASCRLCFVEIEGGDRPVCACTVRVTEPISVKTDTPAVRRLQKTALKLLLTVHDATCKACGANGSCELQRLARFLGVALKPKDLTAYRKEPAVDEGHPALVYHANRCVLCCRCLFACGRENDGHPGLSLARRGFDTVISFYGMTGHSADACRSCAACAEACPVGALELRQVPS